MENKDLQNEIVNAAAEKAAAATNEALETKTNEINATLETKASSEDVLKLAKSIDEMKEKQNETFAIGKSKRAPLAELFADAASQMSTLKKGDVITLNVKDFDSANSSTTYQPYADDFQSQVAYDPNHFSRLRNILGMMPTSGGAITYNQESAHTDSSAPKSKGSAGTQTATTLQKVVEPIQTLFAVQTIPNEWLADIPMVESYISRRLVADLMDTEDTQILTGNGTSPNYNGVNTQGSTKTESTFDTLFGSLANSFGTAATEFDALVATVAGMRDNGYSPSVAILNPLDVAKLRTLKDSENRYQLRETITPDGSIQSFWAGCRIVEHQAQASGTYTVIDPLYVQYFVNGGMSFEFGYNASDFSSNEITARAIQRGGVVVSRAEAAVNGTFTNALASLNA